MKDRVGPLPVASLLLGLVVLGGTRSASGAPAAAPAALKLVADRAIPSPDWKLPGGLAATLQRLTPAYGKSFLEIPTDVRWEDDRHVLVSGARDGTFRVAVDPKDRSPLERVYGPLADMGAMGSHALLGLSADYIAAAAPAHILTWSPNQGPSPRPVWIDSDFNTLIDLDVAGDRLLVLGLQRLEGKKLAEDGAIAWTARLGQKLSDLRPVQFSISGPGARDTDACAPMMIGKVRFLPGGGYVVLPGGEPGVFVHDATGRLRKTWQAETIGFDAGCPISEDEMMLYSINVAERMRWLNGRRIVDEVLSLSQGIGFVIRFRDRGVTRWVLRLLESDGKITSYALPFTSPSELDRVVADARGNRIAFLLSSEASSLRPPGSQRLIVTSAPGFPAPAAKPAPPQKPKARAGAPPKRPPGR